MPFGFEKLESAATRALERAKKDATSLRAEVEASVRSWEHATGEYYSAHPLGCEYVSKVGPGALTLDATASSHDFGLDTLHRLRVAVAHPPGALGVRSAYTQHDDDLEVTTYFEEDRERQWPRPSGVMVCWKDPRSPTILVVRRGDSLYCEVIDLSNQRRVRVQAASSAWRSFGVCVDYEVTLDASGRTLRVMTAEGAVLYERKRRPLAPTLRELGRDLPLELKRTLARSEPLSVAGALVLSHGAGGELFPPMLHIVRAASTDPTDLRAALEDPSTVELPLYPDGGAPWVQDLLAWMDDDTARAKLLDTLRKALDKVNREREVSGARPFILLARD
jgi:hypothetical protein